MTIINVSRFILTIIPFPVAMAKGPHPFPSRTRKLSPSEPMVLPGESRWSWVGDEDAAGNFYLARFQFKLKTGFFIFRCHFNSLLFAFRFDFSIALEIFS
jgi:hypothetical protein